MSKITDRDSQNTAHDSLSAIEAMRDSLTISGTAYLMILTAIIPAGTMLVWLRVPAPFLTAAVALTGFVLVKAAYLFRTTSRRSRWLEIDLLFVQTFAVEDRSAYDLEPEARFWNGSTIVRAAQNAGIGPLKHVNVDRRALFRFQNDLRLQCYRILSPKSGGFVALLLAWIAALMLAKHQMTGIRSHLMPFSGFIPDWILPGMAVTLCGVGAFLILNENASRDRLSETFVASVGEWLIDRAKSTASQVRSPGFRRSEFVRKPPLDK